MKNVELSTGENTPHTAKYSWQMVMLASIAAFVAYTCTYGYRKPYTASSFSGYYFLGLSYKSILVISQVLGYVSGKFYGIRFIASVKPNKRGINIIKAIGAAWISLLLFAVVPPPYNFVFMLINGFPLALVWGLVFGYLEGRRTTEIMGTVLAVSLIFASGLAKTAGKWLMLNLHISEWWMPFTAGFIFIIPLLLSIVFLNKVPPPNTEDVNHRTVRRTMDKKERKQFLSSFGLALTPVIVAYAMLTVLRDFCEDFSNELWKEVGLGNNAEIFVNTSTIVALIVLIVVIGFFFIKNNYTAFQLNHLVIILGFTITIIATLIFSFGKIGPYMWMVTATFGLYLGYVPYNCFYFERMLAAYKIEGTVGFVMYIADSFGYLGTILVLLINEFAHLNFTWVHLFKELFYTASVFGIILTVTGAAMFNKIFVRQSKLYKR